MTEAHAPLGRGDHFHIEGVVHRCEELEHLTGRSRVTRNQDGTVTVRPPGPPDYVAIAVNQAGYAWTLSTENTRDVTVTGWNRAALAGRQLRLQRATNQLIENRTAYAQQAIEHLDQNTATMPTNAADDVRERLWDDVDAGAGIVTAHHAYATMPDDPRCAALLSRCHQIDQYLISLVEHTMAIVVRAAATYATTDHGPGDRPAALAAISGALAAERYSDPAGQITAALAALDHPYAAEDAALTQPAEQPPATTTATHRQLGDAAKHRRAR